MAVSASSSPPTSVSFIVHGIARPKGSFNAFVSKVTQRMVFEPANPETQTWQDAVAWTARQACREPRRGPVTICATFYLPKPQRVSVESPCIKRPDLDKLLRCICDALTGIAYVDDSQVVELMGFKCYAPTTPQTCITVEYAP